MTKIEIENVTLKNEHVTVEEQYQLIRKGKDKGLILKVVGEYGIGSAGNVNGQYIGAHMMAALNYWTFRYIVFDLSELVYKMSNSLMGLFMLVYKHRSPNFPIYIKCSDKCRAGIISLLEYSNIKMTLKIIDEFDQIYNG